MKIHAVFLRNGTKFGLSIFLILMSFLLNTGNFYSNTPADSKSNQKDSQDLQHEVTVTLKLVQVYVTDKKGNPVMDLEKSDFVLFDNKERKPITDFEKYVLSMPPEKKEPLKEPLQRVKPPEKVKLAPEPEKITRKFFIFFDFAFNNVTGIKKSKEAALHFIDTQLQPTDEVGVLSYSTMKSLILHEYLTTNHEKVREVVEGFGVREILGRAEDVEEQYFRKMTGREPVDASKGKGFHISKVFDREMYIQQAANFSIKLKELAKALRYIPGQKHIILFSSGIASSTMYGIGAPFGSIQYSNKHGGRPENIVLRRRYEDMMKEMASSNSPVYTLNAEELRSSIRKDEDMLGVHSLKQFSKFTGGKYYDHVHKYENIMEEIQNLTGSYYVLGYYIDEKWDGKYHEIKVEVKKEGCKVHAQGGYFNPKPFLKYTKVEKRIHLVDLALSETPHLQIPLRFPLVAVPFSIKEKENLIVIAKLPKEKIREVSGEEVELVHLFFDKDDNIVEFKREKRDFSALPEEDLYYHTLLSLSPGEYKCRMVIRNLETGRGAVASSPVAVPDAQEPGLTLSPLLLLPEKDSFYMNDPVKEKRERGRKHPVLLNIFPFDSGQYAPLVKEIEQGIPSLFALLRCTIPGVEEPEIDIHASLIDLTTRLKSPLSVSILSSQRGDRYKDFLLIELSLPELEPGNYSLLLTLEEKKTQIRKEVTSDLVIK